MLCPAVSTQPGRLPFFVPFQASGCEDCSPWIYLPLNLASSPDLNSHYQFAVRSGIQSARSCHHISGTISSFLHWIPKALSPTSAHS